MTEISAACSGAVKGTCFMEFTLIAVGLLFLMNPLVAVMDIFPDFIGCILIFLGVNRLRVASPELEGAVPTLKYMIYASILRTFTFFVSGGFDDITKLSVTVVFAVIEFGLGASLVSTLHSGLSYLNVRYGGNVKESPEFKGVGTVFMAAKGALSVIPQLGAIASDSDSIYEDASEGWAEFSGLLTVSNVVITLIFAVFWGITVFGYIAKMSRDSELLARIREVYDVKRAETPNLFIRRTLIFGLAFLFASVFFLIDFISDGKNYIPDCLFALTSLFGVYVISKKMPVSRQVFISGGACFVLSLANDIYYNVFMDKRFYASFRIIKERFLGEYIALIIFAVLSALALAVYFYYLLGFLNTVLEKHVVKELSDEFVRSNRLNRELKVKNKRLILAFTVFGMIRAASSVAFSTLIVIIPEYWMAHLAVSIILVCLSSALYTRLKEGIIAKYELPTDGDI